MNEIMNWIKPYIIVLITLCTLIVHEVGAQNWAGPDTTICGATGVTLGLASAPDDYCYHWSPATGLNSAFQKRPLANPAKTTEYTMTATGPDFSEKVVDKVKVTISTGGVEFTPSYTEPDATPNQAHAHLTSKVPGTTIIWSIESEDHGCTINSSTGNISYCSEPGDVKIRATVDGDPECYAEGTFRVNVGVKQVFAIDVDHPTRKATEGATLHLVGHNDVKFKAVPNTGESFDSEQPDWTGSTVLPTEPHAAEWVHDAGTPTTLNIVAGGKTVNVERHQSSKVSAGGFSHGLITFWNTVKNFIKPPDAVQLGYKFSETQTSACKPFDAKNDHNVTYEYANVEKFNSPELGTSHYLEGEVSSKVTAKICFPPPYSSVPNPVFVWSTYLVCEGTAEFTISIAKDESKAVPAKWKPSVPLTATSGIKLGAGGEVGVLLPGDIFGVQGSVFGGASASLIFTLDTDSLSLAAKIEPLYIEGGLKVWYLNPNNLVLELKGKYNMLDPIAIKPRSVVDLSQY